MTHHPRPAAVLALLAWLAVLTGCGATDGGADPGDVRLSGTVEAHESDLSFRVPGRIVRLAVDEGMRVTPETTVAELEDADFALAVRRAEADARAAEHALALLRAGTRTQELRVAEAAVARAEEELRFARTEHQRIADLVRRDLAARDQLDRARLQVNVAESALEQARQQLLLLREGPRQEEIARAEAELAGRRAALESARRQLAYTRLDAGVAGLVTVRLAEVGEVVAPGQPIVRVARLDEPWVRAYLGETDLARVRLGQPVTVTVDGLPGRTFAGRLAFISPEAEFTPKTVETRELRVDLVYRVRVAVDDAGGALKLGMPADVTIPVSAPR